MSLRDEVKRSTGFKRSLGYKKMFFTLLNFSFDNTYPKWFNKKNKTSYWLVPALFYKQPSLGIKDSVKGFLLVSKSCLLVLFDVLKDEGDILNPSFQGWYCNKQYHLCLLKVSLEMVVEREDEKDFLAWLEGEAFWCDDETDDE